MDKETIVRELKRPAMYEFAGNEKLFEENIMENIDLICAGLGLPPIIAIDEQKMIKVDGFFIRPDIMVRHADGSMTILEVKKVNEKCPATGPANQMTAVGQLLLYGNVLSAKIGGKVRLALIDNKIYYRTYCAFAGNRLPIMLIDFQKDRVFVPYNGWGGVYGYPADG